MIEHSWNLTTPEAIALQRKLACLVRSVPLDRPVKLIAGADCAYAGGTVVAAAVLCEAGSLKVVATASVVLPCTFPYVPGLLSFREAPAVLAAIRKLPQRPDLLLCDGVGLAHPRRFGLACHVGVILDLPTVGVAKSLLCGAHGPVGLRRGSRRQLRHKGEVVGACVRTRQAVKPLYVSVGHRIEMSEAIRWALRTARSTRICEPIRSAHRLVSLLSRRPRPEGGKE